MPAVDLYVNGRADHQKSFLGRLAVGFKKHGWTTTLRGHAESHRVQDLTVHWGHRRFSVQDGQRAAGRDYMVMERGYMGDRFHWTSLAYNGLNGDGEFDVAPFTDSSRFRRYYPNMLQPWRGLRGDYVLLIDQCPRDCSLHRVPGQDLTRWIDEMRAVCSVAYPGLPVLYRGHPLSLQRPDLRAKRVPLEEDLKRAAVCVTWNSNSGVVSTLAGVPTVVYDPCGMAWPVAQHSVHEKPREGDRAGWAAKMAHCQWLPEELEDGTALDQMLRRYK